jgi:hypothetical protein
MGWAHLLNGELLDSAVAEKFDALLTGDSNVKHQQNLQTRPIAIVVLRARDNRLKTHTPMMERVNAVLESIAPGKLVEIH